MRNPAARLWARALTVLALAFTPALTSAPATAVPPDAVALAAGADALGPLEPLRFLLGEWVGEGSGVPGSGGGTCVFSPILQGRAIQRTNTSDYPAAAGRPAIHHEDLMVIHAPDSLHLRADYFDNEGHVIRYDVMVTQSGAMFVGDRVPGTPRYRLSYAPAPEGRLRGRFEMASPAAPDSFRTYLDWTMKRRGMR